jgi:hypothetical protein
MVAQAQRGPSWGRGRHQRTPTDGRPFHQSGCFQSTEMAQALGHADASGHGNRSYAGAAPCRNGLENGQPHPIEVVGRAATAPQDRDGALTQLRDQFKHVGSTGDKSRLPISDHQVRSC